MASDILDAEIPIQVTTSLYRRCPNQISIRRPTPSNAAALAALYREMQIHYGEPVSPEQALLAAELACLPVSATFDPRVLIAISGPSIVGSAVLNVTFPARKLTRALSIRDLYVAKAMRRKGVGCALVRAAAQLTFAEGFSALDWTTDSDNVAARQMYTSCGARMLHRTCYRLTKDDLADWQHL